MTTIAQAKQSIYDAFITDWGTTTPITLDAENDDLPVDLPSVNIVIRHFTRDQDTIGSSGNRKFRHDGAILVQIYGPLDGGSTTVDNLATTVITTLEAKTLADTVITLASTYNEIGPTDNGYLGTVTTPFYYRETK